MQTNYTVEKHALLFNIKRIILPKITNEILLSKKNSKKDRISQCDKYELALEIDTIGIVDVIIHK